MKKGEMLIRSCANWSLRIALIMLVATLFCMIGAIGADAGTYTITSCGDCHTYPPTDAATARGIPAGAVIGSHATHAGTATGDYGFACTKCHVDNGSSYTHRNGTIDMAVSINGDTGGSYSGHATSFPQTSNPAAYGYCSNTYCHSQGTGWTSQASDTRGWSQPTTSLVWGSQDTCSSCHGYPPSYTNGTTSWGAPKANMHPSHSSYNCSNCHYATTTDGSTIANTAMHVNRQYNIAAGPGVTIGSYTYNSAGGRCDNISCHGGTGTTASWNVPGAVSCLTCHAQVQNGRAAVVTKFSYSSHHVQNTTLSTQDCYACHWEANSSGQTTTYHQNASKAIELVVWGSTTSRATATIVVSYWSNTTGSQRTEYAKLNQVCLGCHNETNKNTAPFSGDTNTTAAYAWDGYSIDARYSQPTTTAWSQFSSATYNVSPKDTQIKAFSAHGRADLNARGWDTHETWPNMAAGAQDVLCIDCHNAHGSSAGANNNRTTSYVSDASGTNSGGNLKDVTAGFDNSTVTYKPTSGGTTAGHNVYNAGAGLCFDCHENGAAGTVVGGGTYSTPWGFNSTFSVSQAVRGYFDRPYWNGTSTTKNGAELRFPNTKGQKTVAGGHFGASRPLTRAESGTIGGLCTPCHDPHGVSPSLGANQMYALPLLKGTWVTSPYKEDAGLVGTARRGGSSSSTASNRGAWFGNWQGLSTDHYAAIPGNFNPDSAAANLTSQGLYGYHIDQNTFVGKTASMTWGRNASGGNILNKNPGVMTLTPAQFGGLCVKCHTTDGGTTFSVMPPKSSMGTWKSIDRIHQSVNTWAATTGASRNVNNYIHSYTCSKCHTPHNTCLPRLMRTNCLDSKHKGQYTSGALSGRHLGSGSSGAGWGRFPAGGGGSRQTNPAGAWNNGQWFFGTAGTSSTTRPTIGTCHTGPNATNADGGAGGTTGTDNSWNSVTPWGF